MNKKNTRIYLALSISLFLGSSLIGWLTEPIIPSAGYAFFKGMAHKAQFGGIILTVFVILLVGLMGIGKRMKFVLRSDMLVPTLVFGCPSLGIIVFIVAISTSATQGCMHPWVMPLFIVALIGAVGCPLLGALFRGMEPDMKSNSNQTD